MSFLKFDHVVLLVSDINQAIENWRSNLGLEVSHRVDFLDAGFSQAFFLMSDDTFIELIAPTDEKSEIAALLRKNGEGIHLISMQVENLEKTTEELQQKGVKLIGAGSARVFIHPKSSNGVLIQLWPQTRPHRWKDRVANGQR